MSNYILVVDDSLIARSFIVELLTNRGYTTEVAANGYEGYAKAVADAPKLVIADVNMPKMNGYAMVRQIRADEHCCGVPVVMVSTENRPNDADQAYAAGANLYLIKPIDRTLLMESVRLLVGEPS